MVSIILYGFMLKDGQDGSSPLKTSSLFVQNRKGLRGRFAVHFQGRKLFFLMPVKARSPAGCIIGGAEKMPAVS